MLIVTAMVELPRVNILPIKLGHLPMILHPPFLTPNGCPVSRVDELVKEAAMMIKCENESGKLNEGR